MISGKDLLWEEAEGPWRVGFEGGAGADFSGFGEAGEIGSLGSGAGAGDSSGRGLGMWMRQISQGMMK